MAERNPMRARKGDMLIDIRGAGLRVQKLLDRDKITPERRAMLAMRLDHLQSLALRVGEDDWLQPMDAAPPTKCVACAERLTWDGDLRRCFAPRCSLFMVDQAAAAREASRSPAVDDETVKLLGALADDRASSAANRREIAERYEAGGQHKIARDHLAASAQLYEDAKRLRSVIAAARAPQPGDSDTLLRIVDHMRETGGGGNEAYEFGWRTACAILREHLTGEHLDGTSAAVQNAGRLAAVNERLAARRSPESVPAASANTDTTGAKHGA